jgi:hypothetical protein
MTELELLFLVLVLIYGWECTCWVPRGSVLLRSWLGRRWRLGHPGEVLGNQRGGLLLAPPLPPLGTVLTANQYPLSLSPEAALAYVAPSINPGWRPTQTGRLIRWAEVREVRTSGKAVLVNGNLFLKAASPSFAACVAGQLRQLSQLQPSMRQSAIEAFLTQSLDPGAVQRRWQEFRKLTARVRVVTNLLFGYLFVLAPLLIWFLGLRLCWLGLLVGLLALTTTTAVSFHRAHKALYPAAEDERFTHTVILLLSPATTIRAQDVLSRPLLESFHPLALAKVFCPEQEFRAFARSVLREIRFPGLPVCPGAEPAAQRAESHAREALQRAVEAFLKQSGLSLEELAQPPAPADDTCRAYCPRCLSQFTEAAGTCADCGGRALVAFPPRALEIEPKASTLEA